MVFHSSKTSTLQEVSAESVASEKKTGFVDDEPRHVAFRRLQYAEIECQSVLWGRRLLCVWKPLDTIFSTVSTRRLDMSSPFYCLLGCCCVWFRLTSALRLYRDPKRQVANCTRPRSNYSGHPHARFLPPPVGSTMIIFAVPSNVISTQTCCSAHRTKCQRYRLSCTSFLNQPR